jgi:hypothetical protein
MQYGCLIYLIHRAMTYFFFLSQFLSGAVIFEIEWNPANHAASLHPPARRQCVGGGNRAAGGAHLACSCSLIRLAMVRRN